VIFFLFLASRSRWSALILLVLTATPRPVQKCSPLVGSTGKRDIKCTHLLKLIWLFVPERTAIPEVPVEPAVLGVGLGLEAVGSMNRSPAVVLMAKKRPYRENRNSRKVVRDGNQGKGTGVHRFPKARGLEGWYEDSQIVERSRRGTERQSRKKSKTIK
jgi:hypothetical protein